MTIAPPSGDSGLTGKLNTAAHFMFAALITVDPDGKQNFGAISVISGGKRFFSSSSDR